MAERDSARQARRAREPDEAGEDTGRRGRRRERSAGPASADDDAPDARDGEAPDGTRRPATRLSTSQAARRALSQIVELTGRQAEGITAAERSEEGWTVGVEVVEDRRIPSSSDILACYEATLDSGGELVGYRRIRRYSRGRGDSSEG